MCGNRHLLSSINGVPCFADRIKNPDIPLDDIETSENHILAVPWRRFCHCCGVGSHGGTVAWWHGGMGADAVSASGWRGSMPRRPRDAGGSGGRPVGDARCMGRMLRGRQLIQACGSHLSRRQTQRRVRAIQRCYAMRSCLGGRLTPSDQL